jgi:hypothetical protein
MTSVSCVVFALIENYSTSKPLKFSPEKSQIFSCDTLVVMSDIESLNVKPGGAYSNRWDLKG